MIRIKKVQTTDVGFVEPAELIADVLMRLDAIEEHLEDLKRRILGNTSWEELK